MNWLDQFRGAGGSINDDGSYTEEIIRKMLAATNLTFNSDNKKGTSGDNLIFGLGGNDTIDGQGGNDWLDGGTGNDTLIGGAGDDVLFGLSGTDNLNGGIGNDYLNGGADNDTLDGGDGNDTLIGGSGDDKLNGGSGNDSIDGGSGKDTIDGGSGDDTILGGLGDDKISGGDGKDNIQGNDGIDNISGGAGNDTIDGGAGNDTIDGGTGDDKILGGLGDDIISGGDGIDTIEGNEGNDTINGGSGNDSIKGGSGNDTITAGSGNDTINAGSGNDKVYTSSGSDVITHNLSENSGFTDYYEGNKEYDKLILEVTSQQKQILDNAGLLKKFYDCQPSFHNGTNVTFNFAQFNAVLASIGVTFNLTVKNIDELILQVVPGGTNQNPVDGNESVSMSENGSLSFNLLANATDDGPLSSLSVSNILVTVPSGYSISSLGSSYQLTNTATGGAATLNVASNGLVTMTDSDSFAAPGQTINITIGYKVNDGQGGVSAGSTATIAYTGANDPIVYDGLNENLGSTAENSNTTFSGNLLNHFTDADVIASKTVSSVSAIIPSAATVTVEAPVGSSSGIGTWKIWNIAHTKSADLVISSNGSVNLIDTGNGTSPFDYLGTGGSISFTIQFRASDGTTTSSLATASFTVNGVNDAPLALNDSFSVDQDRILNGNVLSNDTDPEGSTLSALLVTTTQHGTLSFNSSNGSFSYDPIDNYSGPDSFVYRANDGSLLSGLATVNITVNSVNHAPTNIALSGNAINENSAAGTVIGTLSSTDPDVSNTHTYSLSGADSSFFQIVGNQLQGVGPFNFEGKSSYTVSVTSTDQGGLSFTKNFTINVNDVNEAPTNIALSANTINENLAAGTVIGTLSSTDPDASNTHTYSLAANVDSSHFQIVGNELRVKDPLNFEAKSSYTISVTSTDQGGLSFTKDFTINVNDVNEAPTNIALSASSINENSAPGVVIGTLSSVDPDVANTHIYSLAADADSSHFQIVGNELRVKDPLNFEGRPSYTISVTSTDQGGLSFTKDFTINVNDVNEAPTNIALSANAINENSTAGTVIGTLTSVDPDAANTHTYSLAADADSSHFQIVGNELKVKDPLNFEGKPSYTISVTSTDQGGLSFTKDFTINVNDVNEAPTNIALSASSVNENSAAGIVIGTLSSVDPDAANTHTYSLAAGGDSSHFQIVGNELRVKDPLNFEAKSSYSISVTSTDQNGLSFDKVFTISVNDVNEAPTNIALSASSVNENSAQGVVIGTLSSVDPDAANTHTYSLAADTDSSHFQIVGNELRVKDPLNFEGKPSYTISVTSTDQNGLSFDKMFTINVNDVNEAPTNIALSASSVNENSAAGALIGTLSSVDPDAANTHIYSLAADADSSHFQIVGNELRVKDPLNFEGKPSYTVSVTSTDQGGLSFTKDFTINVNDVNDAPTDGVEHYELTENGTLTVNAANGLLATAFDEDSDNLSIDLSSITVSSGYTYDVNTGILSTLDGSGKSLLTINADGSFSLSDTPVDGALSSAFEVLIEGEILDFNIYYKVTDGQLSTDSSSVITVTGRHENQNPVDEPENQSVNENDSVTFNIFANASDDFDTHLTFSNFSLQVLSQIPFDVSSNGNVYTITHLESGNTATLTVNDDPQSAQYGDITFSNEFDFLGSNAVGELGLDIRVDYTLHDSEGGFVDSGTTITVNGVNDFTDSDESYQMSENEEIPFDTFNLLNQSPIFDPDGPAQGDYSINSVQAINLSVDGIPIQDYFAGSPGVSLTIQTVSETLDSFGNNVYNVVYTSPKNPGGDPVIGILTISFNGNVTLSFADGEHSPFDFLTNGNILSFEIHYTAMENGTGATDASVGTISISGEDDSTVETPVFFDLVENGTLSENLLANVIDPDSPLSIDLSSLMINMPPEYSYDASLGILTNTLTGGKSTFSIQSDGQLVLNDSPADGAIFSAFDSLHPGDNTAISIEYTVNVENSNGDIINTVLSHANIFVHGEEDPVADGDETYAPAVPLNENSSFASGEFNLLANSLDRDFYGNVYIDHVSQIQLVLNTFSNFPADMTITSPDGTVLTKTSSNVLNFSFTVPSGESGIGTYEISSKGGIAHLTVDEFGNVSFENDLGANGLSPFDFLRVIQNLQLRINYTVSNGETTNNSVGTINLAGQNDTPIDGNEFYDYFGNNENFVVYGAFVTPNMRTNASDAETSQSSLIVAEVSDVSFSISSGREVPDALSITSPGGNGIGEWMISYEKADGSIVTAILSTGINGEVLIRGTYSTDIPGLMPDGQSPFDFLTGLEDLHITISYKISDGELLSSGSTYTYVIHGVSGELSAVNDLISTNENTDITFNLLNNDTSSESIPKISHVQHLDTILNDVNNVEFLYGFTSMPSDPSGLGTYVIKHNNFPNAATIQISEDGILSFDDSNGPLGAFDSLNANDHLDIRFEYEISDETGQEFSNTAIATLRINGVNDAPINSAIAASVNENGSQSFNLLQNASDVDAGDVLSLSNVSIVLPSGLTIDEQGFGNHIITNTSTQQTATLSISGLGAVTFADLGAFDYLELNSTDIVINYTITDAYGASVAGSAALTIHGVNDAPVANSDFFETAENMTINENIFANDVDAEDGTNLTLVAVSNVTLSGPGTSNIQITHVGNNEYRFSKPGLNDSILLIQGDGDLQWSDASVDSVFNYLARGEYADINFTYTASDSVGVEASSTATIRIHGEKELTDPNQNPVDGSETIQLTQANDDFSLNLLDNASDADGDPLSISDVFSVTAAAGYTVSAVSVSASGLGEYVVTNDLTGGTASVIINSDGSASVTNIDAFDFSESILNAINVIYRVNDGFFGTTDSSLSVDVILPLTDGDESVVLSENDSLSSGELNLLTNASQGSAQVYVAHVFSTSLVLSGTGAVMPSDITLTQNGNALTKVVVSGNEIAFPSAGVGTFTISSGGHSTSFTVNANGEVTIDNSVNGALAFLDQGQQLDLKINYQVSDGFTSNNSLAVISFTAQGAPIAENDSASGNEDTIISGSVLGNDSDIDGDSLTAVIGNTLPTHGSIILNSNGTFTYTPNANYNGTDSFSYKAFDGSAYSNEATVNLTVNSVNDVPVAVADNFSGLEDVKINGNVLTNDSDVDGNSLTAILVSGPTKGTLTLNSNGAFSYTPNNNYNGTDSFTYKVNDGLTDSANALVTLNLSPVNDAPSGLTVNSNLFPENIAIGSAIASLTTNDVDGDDIYTYTLYGTSDLKIVGDKIVTAANINYEIQNSYDVFLTTTDSGGKSFSKTVLFTVGNVNEAPTNLSLSNSSVNENASNAQVGVLSTTDPDNIPATSLSFTYTLGSGGDNNAFQISQIGFNSFALATKSGLNYEAKSVYNISITSTDSGGLSITKNFTINVNNVNEAPLAVSDSYVVNQNFPGYTVNAAQGVLINDSDPDGNALTVTSWGTPSHGTLSLTSSNGSFTYTPDADYIGSDSFQYTVRDGTINSTGIVNLNVIQTTTTGANVPLGLGKLDLTPNGETLSAVNSLSIVGNSSYLSSLSIQAYASNALTASEKAKYDITSSFGGEKAILTVLNTGDVTLTYNPSLNGKTPFDFVDSANYLSFQVNYSTTTQSNLIKAIAIDRNPFLVPQLAGFIFDGTMDDAKNKIITLQDRIKTFWTTDSTPVGFDSTNQTYFGPNVTSGGIDINNIVTTLSGSTINAVSGNDFIYYLSLANSAITYAGGEGSDIIISGAGGETIYGDLLGDTSATSVQGSGDYIEAGSGLDTIYAGAGHDIILDIGGSSIVWGGLGNDVIRSENGGLNNNINGQDGNDIIYLKSSENSNSLVGTIHGDAGDDIIDFDVVDQTIDLAYVAIFGDAGDDNLSGGLNNDIIDGGDGKDTIDGSLGNDTIYGMAGDDTVQGGAGDDVIYGGDDNDTLRGFSGNDKIYGENGNDFIYGFDGNDTLQGNAGTDTIFGEDGNDIIEGGDGGDTIDGGDGNDTINGGEGSDTLTGGLGVTHFIIDLWGSQIAPLYLSLGIDSGNETDVLTDFSIDDFLDLHLNLQALNMLIASDLNISQADMIDFLENYTSLSTDQHTMIFNTSNDKITFSNLDLGDDTTYSFFLTGNFLNINQIDGTAGNDVIGSSSGYTISGTTTFYIYGLDGDDDIYGSTGRNNYIDGGIGNDDIYGSNGNDALHGGDGFDIIYGNDGNDYITGGDGGSSGLHGGNGNDEIYGGVGSDVLFGDDGIDELDGGLGRDTLWGGAGDDVLWFGDNIEFDKLTGGSGQDDFQINSKKTSQGYLDIAWDAESNPNAVSTNGYWEITDFYRSDADLLQFYVDQATYDSIVGSSTGSAANQKEATFLESHIIAFESKNTNGFYTEFTLDGGDTIRLTGTYISSKGAIDTSSGLLDLIDFQVF